MQQLPIYISVIFLLTVVVGSFLFLRAFRFSSLLLIVVTVVALVQSVLSFLGFYQPKADTNFRFPLLLMPSLILAICFILSKRGRAVIAAIDLRWLILFHTIRVPVEICLFLLAQNKLVPELMTFEGRNLDILSGITAPIVYYFSFRKNVLGGRGIILWNLVCMGLLLNIVINALISVPGPLQHQAFEQPNVAILYFPFALLPAVLVPMVFMAHVVAIGRIRSGAGLEHVTFPVSS